MHIFSLTIRNFVIGHPRCFLQLRDLLKLLWYNITVLLKGISIEGPLKTPLVQYYCAVEEVSIEGTPLNPFGAILLWCWRGFNRGNPFGAILLCCWRGFRSNHSTVTALLPLAHKVAQGFDQPCPPPRTLTMAIDLTKAFDMINHTKLICALSLFSLSNNTSVGCLPT